MSRRHDVHDATGRIEYISGRGTIGVWGTGAPPASATGYAPGCIYHRVDGGAGTALYVNEGTFTSSTWVALGTTALLAAAVAGVAAGYKLARGTVTLDGSNPTTAATGLSTIVAAVVSLKQTTAPGDDPSWLSHNYTGSDGNLDIYAWKNTGGTDPTLVASTNNSATVDWLAVGT